ncbi:MAG TPA: hypothetical protein VFM55_13770 [Micromonosporaceae bacterium]|nr:hypothetical protein [Micromonosporaceae bacterium]
MIGVNRLVLVRHALPELEPDVRSEHWQLGAEGRAAARSLRSLVAEPAYFVASDEPKAVQTLQELAGGLAVLTDPGFGEVRRPHLWSDGRTYRSAARSYVEGVRHHGWEAHTKVAARFGAAVARHAGLAKKARRTLVIGTHGLAPTVWMAGLIRLEPSPADFWEQLRFPDVIDVDLVGRTATRRAG